MTKDEATQKAKEIGCKNILKIHAGGKIVYQPCYITTNNNNMMLASWLKPDGVGFTKYFHRVWHHNVLRIGE